MSDYRNEEEDIAIGRGETINAIGVGMLWNAQIHGEYPNDAKSHWVIMNTMKLNEFYKPNCCEELLNYFKNNLNNFGNSIQDELLKHEIYPNYSNIVTNNNYISLEIYEIKCLPTLETIGIRKTIWIKLIQRRWKKIYQERLNIINKRKSINSLKYREQHGKWENEINYLPSIRDIINF